MEIIRLTATDHPRYTAFRNIYDISFPIYEQRTVEQQQDAFSDSRYHLDCYIDPVNDLLLGFIAYWRFDSIRMWNILQSIRMSGGKVWEV